MRRLRMLGYLLLPAVAVGVACSTFEGVDDRPVDAGPSNDVLVEEAGTDAEAGPADAGADVRAYRYVFVTAGTRQADFAPGADSGLPEADKFCKNEALGVPALKDLTWKALLGHFPDVDPRDRIADGGVVPHDYRLVTGALVFRRGLAYAANGPLTPENLVTVDQNGADASDREVWTGAEPSGKGAPGGEHCARWTGTAAVGITGWTSYSPKPGDTTQWLQASEGVFRACASQHHLYCFEVDP